MRNVLIAIAVTVALLVLIVVGALLSAMLTYVISHLPLMGWYESWMTLPLLILAFQFAPKDFFTWNRPYYIRGSALIEASPLRIWNVIFPEPGKPHYLPSVTAVTAVEGMPDRICIHLDQGLDEEELQPLQTVIEEVDKYRYFRLSYLNNDRFPLFAGDLARSEFFIEQEGDKTRVTLVEKLDKLRLTTVLALLFLNPCRDAARTIKAVCEGTEDPSWMRWAQDEMSREDGSGGDLAGSVTTIGVLVCGLLTLAAFGLVSWIIYALPETL